MGHFLMQKTIYDSKTIFKIGVRTATTPQYLQDPFTQSPKQYGITYTCTLYMQLHFIFLYTIYINTCKTQFLHFLAIKIIKVGFSGISI